MNNKGMTLIELIAVIAIIAILTVMIAPNIIDMRKQTIETTMDNKVQKIHNAAITYAEDNLSSVPNTFTASANGVNIDLDYGSDRSNECMKSMSFEGPDGSYCEKFCLMVYISTLIEKGYLAGDNEDKTEILNSLTGESLNFKRVCVRYDTDTVDISSSQRQDTQAKVRKLVAYIEEENKLYDGLKND